MRWRKEEVEALVKHQGLTHQEIAAELSRQFPDRTFTGLSVRSKYRRMNLPPKESGQNSKWSDSNREAYYQQQVVSLRAQ